ncbi:hypothetical protein [Azospirillum sp.]|uniref:hypothetical protein n=1 Tax=Azospirillum sp. TaxID=34012 RepID=UPI003D72CB84
MARIICDLPNASEEISGIKFREDRGQMVSEEVSDETAERFGRIPGYKVIASKPKEPKGPAPKAGPVKDETAKTEPPPSGDGKDEEKTEDKGDGQTA